MTALHILHITRADSLPPWWNEWQLQQIAAEVPCTAELLDTRPAWQIEAEADHADFMDLKRTQEESRF